MTTGLVGARGARAVVLDIEGTTTSIAFVYETLFPYVREHLRPFLDAAGEDADVRAAIDALRSQAEADLAAGEVDAPQIPSEAATPEGLRSAVAASVLWQMDRDRKTTGLKALQGLMWRHGYEGGTLRGHVYPDVRPTLETLARRGVPVFIYSSGSVAAQKLLFGASEVGDLRPLLAGYFDTTTGPKKEAPSYRAIADAVGLAPSEMLFVTDNLDEAKAARGAGVEAVLAVRPGNPPLAEHTFEEITSLEPLTGRPEGRGGRQNL